jgi:hypothetical protein
MDSENQRYSPFVINHVMCQPTEGGPGLIPVVSCYESAIPNLHYLWLNMFNNPDMNVFQPETASGRFEAAAYW